MVQGIRGVPELHRPGPNSTPGEDDRSGSVVFVSPSSVSGLSSINKPSVNTLYVVIF